MMKSLFIPLGLLGSFALVGSLSAEETYTLYKADFKMPKGSSWTEKSQMQMKEMQMQMVAGGQQMEGKMSQLVSEENKFTQQELDKIKIDVITKSSGGEVEIAGQKMPSPVTDGALKGKELLATPAEGGWQVNLIAGEANAVEAAELETLSHALNDVSAEKIYGAEKRKIGDSWKVKATAFPGFENVDNAKGEMTVTFIGVGERDGQQAAELEMTFDMSGELEDMGQMMAMKGTAKMFRSLDYFKDLSIEMNMKMTIEGEMPGGSMLMTGDATYGKTISITLP